MTKPPESEFDPQFPELMANRMLVSFHKYGPIRDGYPHKLDAMGSLKKRLQAYADTGNTEYLADVANFAMIEFMRPSHPEAHFTPTDDSGSPGRVWHAGGPANQRANDGSRAG